MGRRFKSGWRHHPLVEEGCHLKARLIVLGVLCALCASLFAQGGALQPGDRIAITSSDDASLSVTRTVTRDGYVYVPVVGVTNAAGQNLAQLQTAITSQLRSHGNFAHVKVAKEADPNAPITISGLVGLTTSVPWRPDRHLSYLLAFANPGKAANLDAIQITDAAGRLFIASATTDPALRPGDSVFVPNLSKPDEILVVGGVKTPGGVTYEPGMDANKAIAKAGGISGHGDPYQISVERDGQKLENTVTLLRGDIVRVGLVADRRFVSVQGAVKNPGIVEFKDGMTLLDVIDAAGGVTIKGDLSRVQVKSLIGRTDGRYDVAAIKKGLKPDVKLLASDIVDIPLIGARGR